MLPNAIVTVLFPEASRRDTMDAVSLLARASWVAATITCILGLGLAIVAPILLELLYGKAFAPAADPFRILLVAVVLKGINQILSQAFTSSGRPGIVSALLVLGLAVTVGVMLLLVPRYGLSGAAVAVLISTLVRFALTLLCFPLVLDVPLHRLLPRRHDLQWLLSRKS
jgi:O-antigen/teichoic acid export membrane protein